MILVFSLSKIFIKENCQGRKLSAKKIPPSGNSALASPTMVSFSQLPTVKKDTFFGHLFFVTVLLNTYYLGAMRIKKSLKRRLERLLIAITVIPLVAVLIVVPFTLALYFLVYVPQTIQVGWLVLTTVLNDQLINLLRISNSEFYEY